MKSQQVTSFIASFFQENLSYKLLSFVIALLLWFVVFNRKEFIVSWDLQVQVVLGPDQDLISQTAEKIRVRLSGPRSLVKNYRESSTSRFLKIDLSKRGEGVFEIDVGGNMIDVPRGVKVLSVRPNLVRVEVKSKVVNERQ
jgi:YbbR domain-containing protein